MTLSTSDELVINAVKARYEAGLLITEALVDVAANTDLGYDKVAAIWESHTGFAPRQQLEIDFLTATLGEPTLSSVLPENPRWREVEPGPGDVVARFSDAEFFLFRNGGFVAKAASD